MKEAGDLHFRITGESDKCWNNSLSYQSFIHPLHQQLIGQSRGDVTQDAWKERAQCHGTPQRERERETKEHKRNNGNKLKKTAQTYNEKHDRSPKRRYTDELNKNKD